MAKRKRDTKGDSSAIPSRLPSKKPKPASTPETPKSAPESPPTIQLVAGSYDRILHGVTATILPNEVQFADTFLFNAHTSAIRCLALSPSSALVPKQSQKILLASGSTDERINLYHLSAHAPSKMNTPKIPSLGSRDVAQNPQNRELGSLMHHSSPITALYFPNRAKLLSAGEDRHISVVRTRDWNVLSSIKSPAPKIIGRPSGDTASAGCAPSGINDFAVHPSMKLMISVGKGERCMRLWNLVTGKKAGVLNFNRSHFAQLQEGRHSTGEGRKVVWGSTEAGDEFCVGFERGLIVYGMDSEPRCIVLPEPRTKIHQMSYIPVKEDDMALAVSTEDGRILFYSTKPADLSVSTDEKTDALPSAKLISQLGGKAVQLPSRIKDFSVLDTKQGERGELIITTAGSDGALRLWRVHIQDLMLHKGETKQIGTLLGTYETNNRITCLAAFVMLPSLDHAEDDEESEPGRTNDDDSISDSE